MTSGADLHEHVSSLEGHDINPYPQFYERGALADLARPAQTSGA